MPRPEESVARREALATPVTERTVYDEAGVVRVTLFDRSRGKLVYLFNGTGRGALEHPTEGGCRYGISVKRRKALLLSLPGPLDIFVTLAQNVLTCPAGGMSPLGLRVHAAIAIAAPCHHLGLNSKPDQQVILNELLGTNRMLVVMDVLKRQIKEEVERLAWFSATFPNLFVNLSWKQLDRVLKGQRALADSVPYWSRLTRAACREMQPSLLEGHLAILNGQLQTFGATPITCQGLQIMFRFTRPFSFLQEKLPRHIERLLIYLTRHFQRPSGRFDERWFSLAQEICLTERILNLKTPPPPRALSFDPAQVRFEEVTTVAELTALGKELNNCLTHKTSFAGLRYFRILHHSKTTGVFSMIRGEVVSVKGHNNTRLVNGMEEYVFDWAFARRETEL